MSIPGTRRGDQCPLARPLTKRFSSCPRIPEASPRPRLIRTGLRSLERSEHRAQLPKRQTRSRRTPLIGKTRFTIRAPTSWTRCCRSRFLSRTLPCSRAPRREMERNLLAKTRRLLLPLATRKSNPEPLSSSGRSRRHPAPSNPPSPQRRRLLSLKRHPFRHRCKMHSRQITAGGTGRKRSSPAKASVRALRQRTTISSPNPA